MRFGDRQCHKETSPETVAPLSEENVKASAVSDDAVKVYNNLDATKKIYEKLGAPVKPCV